MRRGPVVAVAVLAIACGGREAEVAVDADPREPGPPESAFETESGEERGTCSPAEEEGVEGFDYLVRSDGGALRIELREADFGHKMVRVVEQRPGGVTRDLRYRSPEEELVVVESEPGEEPVRRVVTGSEAIGSPEAEWLGVVLGQAMSVCGYGPGFDEPEGP